MFLLCFLFIAALFVLLSGVAFAQQEPAAPGTRPQVHAYRLAPEDTIALDGVLDEAVWRRAEAATNFLQRDPINGAPATERTEVRIAYDENRIIIGVQCFDSEPHRLLGNQMQRDQPFSADDRFMWALDPYMDGRTGYFF